MKLLYAILISLFLLSCGDKESEKNDNDSTISDSDIEQNDEDAETQPEIESLTFTIPEEKTEVISNNSKHFAFPDIAQLENGKIMLVYRQGSGHAEDSGRIIAHYTDDGVNWSDPEMLVDDSTIDDRDPSI